MKNTIYCLTVLILAAALLAACGSASQLPASGKPSAPAVSGVYPTKPEGVLRLYLGGYEEAPDRMVNYMSASLRQQTNSGGPAAALLVSGPVDGFTIQSATVNPDPATAEVRVDLSVGNQTLPRMFYFIKENGNWVISQILAVK